MIAGICGMNFEAMLEMHWTYAYPIVLIFTFCICIVLYILFSVQDGYKIPLRYALNLKFVD